MRQWSFPVTAFHVRHPKSSFSIEAPMNLNYTNNHFVDKIAQLSPCKTIT